MTDPAGFPAVLRCRRCAHVFVVLTLISPVTNAVCPECLRDDCERDGDGEGGLSREGRRVLDEYLAKEEQRARP